MNRYLTRAILWCLCFFTPIYSQGNREMSLGSREGDPEGFVQNVSVIHGDYSEVETDIVVPAPDPLRLSRFYSSRDFVELGRFGGWKFNSQCYLSFDKEVLRTTGSFQKVCAVVGNSHGSIYTYEGWVTPETATEEILLRVDPQGESLGICNNARGSISSWTNPKNNTLKYDPRGDRFELTLASLGMRFYEKGAAPDLYLLTKEILPSGNRILYEYDSEGRLLWIKETDAQESKVLAWIHLEYGDGVHVKTSDGKWVDYTLKDQGSGADLLVKVERFGKPPVQYRYEEINGFPRLIGKNYPEGRGMEVEYQLSEVETRVQSLSIPLNDQESSQWRFFYGDDFTEVFGPCDRKTIYRYDQDLRLTDREEYLEGALYRTYKKCWGTGANTGNLISACLEDANGDIFHYKHFSYDEKGNVIEEREYGDFSGKGSVALLIDEEGVALNAQGKIKNTTYFSDKEFDGYYQIDGTGGGVKCWYHKGTSLLAKQIHAAKVSRDTKDDDSSIFRRSFYNYNKESVLTRVITDDGPPAFYHVIGGENKAVPSRGKVTLITPKSDLPNVGAPEIIEERSFFKPFYQSNPYREALVKKTINHFDDEGQMVSKDLYDAEDQYQYSYHFSYSNGLLIGATDPKGNETRYTYDGNHNLVLEEKLSLGISSENQYDLQNHLVKTIQKNSSGESFVGFSEYDSSGNVTREVDRLGSEVSYIRDGLGRTREILYSDLQNDQSVVRSSYSFNYDIFDHVISAVDASGSETIHQYTLNGLLAETAYPDGSREVYEYDSGGNLRRQIGRNGVEIEYTYDSQGRITEENHLSRGTSKSHKSFKYEYSPSHLSLEVDEKGRKTTYKYDDHNRVISFRKGGRKVELFYDSLGRVKGIKKWKTESTFSFEVKEYDAFGRLLEERVENESGKELLKKRYVYNNAGQLEKILGYPQNQESILFAYEYDAFGRLIRVANAVSQSTSILYDDRYIDELGRRGQKRTSIDPLGNQVEKVFDPQGNLVKTVVRDSSGKIVSSTVSQYDLHGNLVHQSTGNIPSLKSKNTYDVSWCLDLDGRLKSKIYGEGSAQELLFKHEYNAYGELEKKFLSGFEDPIEYQYDPNGNLKEIKCGKDLRYAFVHDLSGNIKEVSFSPRSKIEYLYNEHDNLLGEKVQDEFGSYKVACSYDGEGKVDKIVLPDGSSISYGYEGPFVKNIRRLNKDQKEQYTHSIQSRDLMGNILEESLPGYVGSRRQTWDHCGRKTGIQTDFFEDRVPEGGYDCRNNILKRQISIESEARSAEYAYDALDQLLSEKGSYECEYQYDILGNRTKRGAFSCSFNSANQIIESGDGVYTFGANGALQTKTAMNQTWTMESNALGHIVSIQCPDLTTVSFTYSPGGKRLSKRIEKKGRTPKTLRFFYFGDEEIGCIDEKGVIRELKIPSDPNMERSPSIAIEIERGVYVPIQDFQGNIACLVDPQRRKVVESYSYSAFGEEEIFNGRKRRISSSSVGNPWRYQEKRKDDESGLIYFGIRYYEPETGRWVSPDPLGTIDGHNLYTYARNNPIKYVDPFGLVSEESNKSACKCGYCIRGEGFCHCRGQDPNNSIGNCVCLGIDCCHKSFVILTKGSSFKSSVGVITNAVTDFFVGASSSPRVQGSLQAFAGLAEAGAGAYATLGTGGLAAPVGWPVLVHGLDQFITGLNIAFSGEYRNALTSQLLQITGISAQTAGMIDSSISIVGSMGSIAIIRARQFAALPSFSSHKPQNKDNITLYRAVKPQELSDIKKTQVFRNLGDAEGKYFTTSIEGASFYAKQAVKGFGDPPYTLIRTQVPNNVLKGAPTLVDGGIPAWVIFDQQLEGLIPEVLNWMVVP